MSKYPLVKIEKQESADYPYDKWFRQHVEIAEAFVRGDKREDGTYGFRFIHKGKSFPDPVSAEFILAKFFDRVRSVAETYWTAPNIDYGALSKWGYATLKTTAKLYDIAAEYQESKAMQGLEPIVEDITPDIYVFRPTIDGISRIRSRLESHKIKNRNSLKERIFTFFSRQDRNKWTVEDFKAGFAKDNLEEYIRPAVYKALEYRSRAKFLDLEAERYK